MQLESSAFKQGANIPKQYTCDGADISLPLIWRDVPSGTKSFVLILDDPDAPAGKWVHWIVFNIPSTVNNLDENIQTLPAGAKLGKNSWGRNSYNGPCPPAKHRYFLQLYALDIGLDLPSGANQQQIHQAMQGHILAEAKLMGTYP